MKRHALFVGVDEYVDPTINKLEFSTEDATELASVFRRILKFDRVEKLMNPAHAPDVVDSIKKMTRGLGSGDLFLFFFAGHGFRVKENHVLVCSKDEYADLENEYAGLQVGQVKMRMCGPWNQMLVLDACQNDIRSSRGADCGMASRDLNLIHESNVGISGSGYKIVVTSCSEGQKALEVSDLGHGLFTSAFLDSVTAFADDRLRIDLESLRMDLGGRMNHLIAKYHLVGSQVPMFTMPSDAKSIVLLDGAVPSSRVQTPNLPTSTSAHEYVICPKCGKHNLVTNTFRCKVCGKDNLCLAHFSQEHNSCKECAETASERARQNLSPQELYDQGMAYQKGDRCAKSEVEAFKCFKKAASAHYVKAMEELAECYYYGRGVTKSYVMAHWWLVQAAFGGKCSGYAYYSLGYMAEYGQGVEKSVAQAELYYRKAVEKGNINAKEPLQKLLSAKERQGREVIRLVEEYGNKTEYLQSLTADPSVKEAIKCCHQGDYARAWKLLSAASQDCSAVQYCIAEIYSDERKSRRCGITPDETSSFALMKSSAEKGNVVAMWKMAWNDKAHRVTWLRKAADNGHAEAINKLAGLLAGDENDNKEWCIAKDLGESLRYLKFGAKLGSTGAIMQWKHAIDHPKHWPMTSSDFEELRQYLIGLDSKFDWAAYEVGRIYELGLCGTVDIEEAKRWYEKRQWHEANARVNSLVFKMKLKHHGRLGGLWNVFALADLGTIREWCRDYSGLLIVMALFGVCLGLLLYWRYLLENG